MLARETRGFFVPAKRATDKMNLVRCHRFAIARPAENNAALAFAARNRLRRRPNEDGVINRVLIESAAVLHFVAERYEKFFNLLLVTKAGVIAPQRNFHALRVAQRFNAG